MELSDKMNSDIWLARPLGKQPAGALIPVGLRPTSDVNSTCTTACTRPLHTCHGQTMPMRTIDREIF